MRLVRRISGPVDKYNIAPDSQILHETARSTPGSHANGRAIRNLHQCHSCLAWSPLTANACGRCGRGLGAGG